MQLYDRYAAQAFALAVRMLGDPATAGDVVEAVFLDTVSAAPGQNDDAAAQTQLLAMVHRRCAERRGAPRNPSRDYPAAPPATPKSGGRAASGASGLLDESRVRQAAAALAPEQYQALCLAYFDGLDCAAIAGTQGVPVATATERLRRGLTALQALLAPANGQQMDV